MKAIFSSLLLTPFLVSICVGASEAPPDLTGQVFFKKFVKPGKPVLTRNLLSGMAFQNKLPLKRESLKQTGLAAVTVYGNEVLSDLLENGHEFQERLHFNLKTRLNFPPLLMCDLLMKNHLYKTVHKFGQVSGQKEEIDYHRLRCLIEDYQNVTVRSGLEDQTFWMTPDDCLYVPKGFAIDRIDNVRHWISLWWKGDDDCKSEIKGDYVLSDRPWPGDGVFKAVDRSSNKERQSLDNLVHMIENYMITKDGITNFDQFLRKAKVDNILVPNLPEWNDECTSIAEELFTNLDSNKDAKLNRQDLEEVKNIDLNFWAGTVRDRFLDFSEIIFDLRADKMPLTIPEVSVLEIEEMMASTENYYKKLEEKRSHRLKDEL